MRNKISFPIWVAGLCAGVVTGLLGAGGGMVLVPLLGLSGKLAEKEVFSASVAIMLPICALRLLVSPDGMPHLTEALPYLLGSAAGGLLATVLGKHIPTAWLHRALGILILWGGIRNLC